jgi:ribonuclease HI
MVAEGRALLDGLRLTVAHSIYLTVIYSDSLSLVSLINAKEAPPWSLLYWWQELLELLSCVGCLIKHILRESNQLADSLAGEALNREDNSQFCTYNSLPHRSRGIACTDASGLPNIRLRWS